MKIGLHHEHPVLDVETPTRRYFVCNLEERKGFSWERNFLRREKRKENLRQRKAGKRGNVGGGIGELFATSVTRSSKSLGRKETQKMFPINFFFSRFVCFSIESLNFHFTWEKTINKGNDNQLDSKLETRLRKNENTQEKIEFLCQFSIVFD